MISNLGKILIPELQMNIDFMYRIRDNFNSGILRIPTSFFHHISVKYSIPMTVLEESHQEIVEFILPMFVKTPVESINVDKFKPKKRALIDELPVAKFA